VVETVARLPAPEEVFTPEVGVDKWTRDGDAAYVLTVAEPRMAAPKVTRALVAAGADVLSIAVSHHSLEDVYLELVEADPEASR
jgi:ABC-2 type transport system ATP-binding protein